jgi:hypothetical protein
MSACVSVCVLSNDSKSEWPSLLYSVYSLYIRESDNRKGLLCLSTDLITRLQLTTTQLDIPPLQFSHVKNVEQLFGKRSFFVFVGEILIK